MGVKHEASNIRHLDVRQNLVVEHIICVYTSDVNTFVVLHPPIIKTMADSDWLVGIFDVGQSIKNALRGILSFDARHSGGAASVVFLHDAHVWTA